MQNFRTLGLIIKKVRNLFNLPDKYGKIIQCALNTIFSFNKTEESWQPAGQMTVPRAGHAAELSEDVSQNCP